MDSLQEQLKKLQEENDLYKQNGAVGLYYELNRFINTTVKIMRQTSIEGLLVVKEVPEGENKKNKEYYDDPKKFEKIMALIKNAKEHVSDMIEMKIKLNLSGDEEKDKKKPFITTVAQNRS